VNSETIKIEDAATCAILMRPDVGEAAHVHGFYTVECRDADGNLKWTEIAENIVTTVGKNEILDRFLAGSTYTTSLFMGLKGTGSTAAGDTMPSHAGWLEVGGSNAPAYTGTRPVPAFVNAASSGVKTQSTASSYAITSGGTVDGVFIVCNTSAVSTKDNTGGVLLSVGTFSGGSRVVANADTLSITYSLTLT